MSKMLMKTQLNAPADAVWKTIRDFGGIGKFIASVKGCTVEGSGVGAVRTLDFGEGPAIVERLEKLDDQARSLTYSIVSAPLPMEGYVSTMTIVELSPSRCELWWTCVFTPKGATEAELNKIIEGVYSEGFAGLKKLHGA
jgi:hypothetical protein